MDSKGNFYGTTAGGGAYKAGTVVEFIPPVAPHLVWQERILHQFLGGANNTTDGNEPYGNLIMDSEGNLYGTTKQGGAHGYGIVLELSRSGSGWTERVLWNFGGVGNGAYPKGSLVMDYLGNLYGGGTYADGVVFELAPSGTGGWFETILQLWGRT